MDAVGGPRHDGEVTRTVAAGAVGTTVDEFRAASIAPNTLRAYGSDLRQFQRWLAGYTRRDPRELDDPAHIARFSPCPSTIEEVEAYLRYLANEPGERDGEYFYAPSTIARTVAALNWAHDQTGVPSPARSVRVRTLLAGIKRSRKRPTAKAAPLMLSMQQRVVLQMDISSPGRGALGVRDAAIFTFGLLGAFRRSEFAPIDVGDVVFNADRGVTIRVKSSKTDQEGRGGTKGYPFKQNVAHCGPCAYMRWYRLLAAKEKGRAEVFRALRDNEWAVHVCREPHPPRVDPRLPFFRRFSSAGNITDDRISGGAVGLVVKRRCEAAGLDVEWLSGHSLRAGFITEGFERGASPSEIMQQTGQTDPRTVEGYRRHYAPLIGNAVNRMGD